jgi:predicted kinase
VITVVSGPPCAGKSTYITENRQSGDVVVDLDPLLSAFGASERSFEGSFNKVALAARAAAIDTILAGVDCDAWIIDTNLLPDSLAKYMDAGAEFVALDPGMDECLTRAAERPEWTADVIRDWYAARSECKGVRELALAAAARCPDRLTEILAAVRSAVGAS